MSASSATLERSARADLRARTQAAHEAVDEVFGAFDLGSASGYARFLQAHAAAYLPIEDGLDLFGAERLLPDWAERRRGPALRADLADLGLAAEAIAPMRVVDADAAWGSIYVLEGSRFGGRLITRALAPDQPCRYIGAVHRPGAWNELVSRMEVALSGAAQRQDAVDAALAAFARFEDAGRRVLAMHTR